MTRHSLRDRSAAPPSQFPAGLAMALVLGGVALNLAPPELRHLLRSAVRDALAPGQKLLRSGVDAAMRITANSPLVDRPDSTAGREGEMESLRSRNRQLELELATARVRLTEALSQGRRAKAVGSPPLLVSELIEARWLGEETSGLWRSRALLAAGAADRLVESALVLQSDLPLVDVGGDAQLAAGDAVYAGRVVLGKIAEVGRYSSTVCLVTDAEFSGRARVARRTDRGLEVIAEGTLVGDGGHMCRLKHVAEPVALGDEVYTGGTDGIVPYPMYYGRVVEAELAPAAREWTVTVKPAAERWNREKVEILRLSLNPERLSGN